MIIYSWQIKKILSICFFALFTKKKKKKVPLWSKTFIFTNNIFCFFPTTLPQEPDEQEQKLQLPDAQAVLAGYISLIILYETGTGKLSFPTGLRVSADFGITKIISKFYILHDNEVEKMKLFFSFLIKN